MSQKRIFISHSSKDSSFCSLLVQSLKAAEADVCYDRDSLKGGLLYERLTDELRTRPVFIPVLSKDAVTSSFVKNECHWAFILYENEPNRLILPVLAQALNFSDMAAFLYLAGFVRVEAPNHQP